MQKKTSETIIPLKIHLNRTTLMRNLYWNVNKGHDKRIRLTELRKNDDAVGWKTGI